MDAIAGYISVILLIVTFSYLKDEIPSVNPYSWDPLFAQLDRFLHGGHDPWTLLQAILGSPYLTTLVNMAYHGWFVLIYMAVCLACIDRRDPNRSMTFLVAFALCWSIGGNLMAIIFSSVGPVYYQPFGFGDTFVPLVEFLHESHEISPVWALEWHQLLLDGYFNDGPISGISAMPSMHVATSVLLAIYGFSYSRWLGWSLTAFAVVIMLGSVHLAWHYAIDGYVSTALVFFLWWLAKKLTARFGPET
ncbi:phosphatase PAP2 family protein [uncultured Ruegeria sp.]|uniref:phosphatase PAP2 family protein n=1 Tax=uncultured Ruegeria sp. TaxID=259304 RepID=UPI00261BDE4E|nr:phosphatase PAP2 family protein [uncultured Ruegeria sp.]